ncbi:hypothetical protein C5S36_10690, partial [Candidatus Methanophagaceae archaeon]
MRIIVSMLLAVALSVYTLGATCWYAATTIFNFVIPAISLAFIVYLAFIYFNEP